MNECIYIIHTRAWNWIISILVLIIYIDIQFQSHISVFIIFFYVDFDEQYLFYYFTVYIYPVRFYDELRGSTIQPEYFVYWSIYSTHTYNTVLLVNVLVNTTLKTPVLAYIVNVPICEGYSSPKKICGKQMNSKAFFGHIELMGHRNWSKTVVVFEKLPKNPTSGRRSFRPFRLPNK